MLNFATGRTTVISRASENGGQAHAIRKSPSWITLQPLRSISKKQSLRCRLSSTNSASSSLSASTRSVSHSVPLSSTSTSLSCPIVPRFTRGGHSALRKTVWTSSSRRASRASGSVGWSPNVAIVLVFRPSASAFDTSHGRPNVSAVRKQLSQLPFGWIMKPVSQNEPTKASDKIYAPTVGKAHIETETCAKIMMLAITASICHGPFPCRLRPDVITSRSDSPQINPVRAERAMSDCMPAVTVPSRYQTPKEATKVAANMRWTVEKASPIETGKCC